MAFLLCKQISCDSFKKEITNKLFTYKYFVYAHLNMHKQITGTKLLLLHIRNHFTVSKQMINS